MDGIASSSEETDWDSDEQEVRRVPTGILYSRNVYLDGRLWYDENANPLKRREIFELPAGEERTRRLKEIVEDFPNYGAKIYDEVIDAERPDLVRLLLELGASAISPDEHSSRPVRSSHPLRAAAVSGQLECVQLLVEQAGVRINEVDRFGDTALMLAAQCGYGDVVRWLLRRGASVALKVKHRNIVSLAMESGQMDIVEAILENEEAKSAGIVCSLENLHRAAMGGNVEIVDLVLSTDCFPSPTGDLKALAPDQRSELLEAMEEAIRESAIACLRSLLPYATRQRPDGWYDYFQAENSFGRKVYNALRHGIIKADDPDLFQTAWESIICPPGPADSDTREDLHASLTEATEHGRLETVKRIHERYDVDFNRACRNSHYATPFGAAVLNSSWDFPEERLAIAKYLLEHADVDIHVGQGEVANGESCLAAAVHEQHEGMIRLLLSYGGPVESIDKTIYQYLEGRETGERVAMSLVVDRRLPNKPLRILTPTALASFVGQRVERETASMTLEWEKTELVGILDNLQIRKTAEQLLMSDPTREVVKFRRRR